MLYFLLTHFDPHSHP